MKYKHLQKRLNYLKEDLLKINTGVIDIFMPRLVFTKFKSDRFFKTKFSSLELEKRDNTLQKIERTLNNFFGEGSCKVSGHRSLRIPPEEIYSLLIRKDIDENSKRDKRFPILYFDFVEFKFGEFSLISVSAILELLDDLESNDKNRAVWVKRFLKEKIFLRINKTYELSENSDLNDQNLVHDHSKRISILLDGPTIRLSYVFPKKVFFLFFEDII